MAKERAYAKLGVTVQISREGEYFIAYSPAFDFSSCGKSLEEAQQMFSKGIRILIDELYKMGTLEDVLLECGWRKVKKPKPHYVPPEVIAHTEQQVEIPWPA